MIRYILVLIFIGFCAGYSVAQDVEYSNRLIKRLNEIVEYNKAGKIAAGQGHEHRLCISSLLKEAKKNYSILTPAAQKAFKVADSRPVITDEKTVNSKHFKIHYAISGPDSTSVIDVSNNGLPDIIDSMMVVFEYVYQTYQDHYGYYMPPSDGNVGGDSLYDIYVHDIGIGLYGFVVAETDIGDNPNSPNVKEINANTSYMGMNRDYKWATASISILDAIKVTAAHEYFHAIQNGITDDHSQFFAESTATCMEDVLYGGIDDNFQYLPRIFDSPDVALDVNDMENPGAFNAHWYAGWIYWRYIREHLSIDFIKDTWIKAITEYEDDAYNLTCKEYGTDFKTTFDNWIISNYVMSNNSAYSPYTYERANVYKSYLANSPISNSKGLKIEGTLKYTGYGIDWSSSNDGNGILMRMSADYFNLTTNQNFKISMTPEALDKGMDFYMVKLNSKNNNFGVQHATLVGDAFEIDVTDASLYDKFGLVVSRFDTNAVMSFFSTASVQYSVKIAGVNAVASQHNVKVNNMYPNPAKEQFCIDYSCESPVEAEVMDYTGKVLYHSSLETSSQGKHIVSSANWQNGIYFVFIKDNGVILAREKIVITK